MAGQVRRRAVLEPIRLAVPPPSARHHRGNAMTKIDDILMFFCVSGFFVGVVVAVTNSCLFNGCACRCRGTACQTTEMKKGWQAASAGYLRSHAGPGVG